MPIPPGSRAYIDTNVFVYHLVDPSHPQERFCSRFLQDIEDGNVTGVVTTFVINEFQAVTKGILARANGAEPSPGDLVGPMEDLEKLFNDLGVEERDADALAGDMTGRSVVFGDSIRVINDAGVARVAYWKRGRRVVDWRTIGGADALHAIYAERAGATHVATCDKAFRRLRGPVAPAVLEDMYP